MSGTSHPFGLDLTEEEAEHTRKLVLQRSGPSRRVMVPTLRVIAGRDMLRHVVLQAHGEFIVGRDEGCALRLVDVSVSRRHAKITTSADGSITVHDLGSTNGTAVNGQPVSAAEIRTGDAVEFGAVSLKLDLLSLDEIAHLENVVDALALAHRDPLTGLLTRAWLEDDLPSLCDRAARAGAAISCVFVDVDHFKRVNDTFGHGIGDDVLVGVARILLLGVREADACVRYGGEEFVVFLPASDERSAHEVADRIRRAIEAHDWSRTANGLRVTASMGVAQLLPNEARKDWIARADRALYAAKHAGRNTVRRAGDGRVQPG